MKEEAGPSLPRAGAVLPETMMSVESEREEVKVKSDPAVGALGKSSRVIVYTPPSPGTSQRIWPSPVDSMPFWITFPFHDQRR